MKQVKSWHVDFQKEFYITCPLGAKFLDAQVYPDSPDE